MSKGTFLLILYMIIFSRTIVADNEQEVPVKITGKVLPSVTVKKLSTNDIEFGNIIRGSSKTIKARKNGNIGIELSGPGKVKVEWRDKNSIDDSQLYLLNKALNVNLLPEENQGGTLEAKIEAGIKNIDGVYSVENTNNSLNIPLSAEINSTEKANVGKYRGVVELRVTLIN